MAQLLLILMIVSTVRAQDGLRGRMVGDPYKSAPLSFEYRLPETNNKPLTVRVLGKTKDAMIAHTYPAGYGTKLPVHGLYPDWTNTVIIEQEGKKRMFKIPLPPLPEDFKVRARINVDRLPRDNPFNRDLFFMSVVGLKTIVGVDRKGDIRYIGTNDYYYAMRMDADNGEIVIENIAQKGGFSRRTLLGRDIVSFPLQAHHDKVPFKKNFIVAACSKWGWEDAIVEIDGKGTVLKELLIGDVLRKAIDPKDTELLDRMVFDDKNIYQRAGTNVRMDWAHVNSIVYDQKKDILYMSLRHQGVFAVKYKPWKLLWWMANDKRDIAAGFGYGKVPKNIKSILDIPSLQKYRKITQPGEAPRNQHGLFLRKNGNLIMFDNNGDTKNPEGSRVLEFAFEGKNARLVRSYTHPKKYFSKIVSDVDLTGQNHENLLILWGSSYPNHISEVAPDDSLVFDMTVQTRLLIYRADKMPLYPYADPKKKYALDAWEL